MELHENVLWSFIKKEILFYKQNKH